MFPAIQLCMTRNKYQLWLLIHAVIVLGARGSFLSRMCPVVGRAQPRPAWSRFLKVRNECPHPDQCKAHKVGKQQRGHRWSAIDQSVKEAVTGINEICLNVEPESQYADQGLSQHHYQTYIQE